MSVARDRLGQWLSAAALSRTARLSREFDLYRDPLIARQLADLHLTEAQRREAAAAGASEKREKPEPALRPSGDMRTHGDREGWLAAQRDAAFARLAAGDAGLARIPEPGQRHEASSPEPSM